MMVMVMATVIGGGGSGIGGGDGGDGCKDCHINAILFMISCSRCIGDVKRRLISFPQSSIHRLASTSSSWWACCWWGCSCCSSSSSPPCSSPVDVVGSRNNRKTATTLPRHQLTPTASAKSGPDWKRSTTICLSRFHLRLRLPHQHCMRCLL